MKPTKYPPVVRGRKIAHTDQHANCTACHIALDAAYERRADI